MKQTQREHEPFELCSLWMFRLQKCCHFYYLRQIRSKHVCLEYKNTVRLLSQKNVTIKKVEKECFH